MKCRPSARRGAFTLVEVTLALGVAAVGFLAVFGLLPVGINSNQAAIEQTAAGSVLTAVAADLRSTPPSITTSPQFNIAIPANPVTASATVSRAYVTADGKYEAYASPLPADAHFLLTVTFLPNGSNTRAATLAQLKVSWPAAAGATQNLGSVEQVLALDRN